MTNKSIVICGLPDSGKTTFLAALWHLISAKDVKTALTFKTLQGSDFTHLNSIMGLWLEAKKQIRTDISSNQVVTMSLIDLRGETVRVSFPDLNGETYQRMWEDRECDPEIADILMSGQGILLFIHADRIKMPGWVAEEAAYKLEAEQQGKPTEVAATDTEAGTASPSVEAPNIPWHPRLAPTQVQVVDLMQLLRKPPLDIGPRRVVVMLSAWDLVADEGLSPQDFLCQKLPLLHQYLEYGVDRWTYRVCGLSAQGGDYATEAESLCAENIPSKRIRLINGTEVSHDITEPLVWLME